MLRGRHERRGGLGPRRAGEPVRAQDRRRCSRSTPGSVARGRAAAVRGLLLRRRHRAPRSEQVLDAFRPITLGGAAASSSLVATPLLWALTRRLDRAGRGPGAAAGAAVDASEAERRRIARDLHDGVVQDLAGTAFALSATARDPGTDAETAARGSSRWPSRCAASLRSLRSLLVEIYPPDLGADGLAAALDDLVAPAAGAGRARRRRGGRRRAAPPTTRSGWSGGSPRRRSATRCGTRGAEHLDVQVGTGRRPARPRRHRRRPRLRPAPRHGRRHFGLRGLREPDRARPAARSTSAPRRAPAPTVAPGGGR